MKKTLIDFVFFAIGGGCIIGGFFYNDYYMIELAKIDISSIQSIPHNHITPALIIVGIIILINYVLFSKGFTTTHKKDCELK